MHPVVGNRLVVIVPTSQVTRPIRYLIQGLRCGRRKSAALGPHLASTFRAVLQSTRLGSILAAALQSAPRGGGNHTAAPPSSVMNPRRSIGRRHSTTLLIGHCASQQLRTDHVAYGSQAVIGRVRSGCLLWVKSGKAHDEHNTSAIPSRADIERRLLDVRFGPEAEIPKSNRDTAFDDIGSRRIGGTSFCVRSEITEAHRRGSENDFR
jgi:hypothetical protein